MSAREDLFDLPEEKERSRSLLACSSDYFRAMFKSYTQESKASVIHLQVVSPTGLQHVLDFIYTSLLPLSFESLEDTLEAASYLQVTDAIGLCNQYLVNNLTLENCCFSANVARKFYLPDALAATEKYIINNLWKLLCLIIKAINYHTSVFRQPVLQDKSTTLRNQKTRIILLGGGTASEGLVTDVVAFDVYNHRWRALTQVQDRVQNHSMCVVGNFLYVLGGEIEGGAPGDAETDKVLSVTNKVHRYDPRFNRWTQITSMLEKRCQFSCCVLGNNICAIGGRGENGVLHSSVEVYDISRDRWMKAREFPSGYCFDRCPGRGRGTFASTLESLWTSNQDYPELYL
uniref:Kelch like family member 34 n=1 Tax=Apteryx owenii TaxID=8824 RepID=A0A8B9P2J8_APTOW